VLSFETHEIERRFGVLSFMRKTNLHKVQIDCFRSLLGRSRVCTIQVCKKHSFFFVQVFFLDYWNVHINFSLEVASLLSENKKGSMKDFFYFIGLSGCSGPCYRSVSEKITICQDFESKVIVFNEITVSKFHAVIYWLLFLFFSSFIFSLIRVDSNGKSAKMFSEKINRR
jgi:hypothetical protein